MLLNYHEMTLNEPRDSPARRQQFKVICTIMAGMFIHSVITAGAFMDIHIKEGVFPGGEFIYRYNQRCVQCDCWLINVELIFRGWQDISFFG